MKKGFLWVDVPGYSLTAEDKEVLAHPAVSGVILFSKNFESIPQLQSLTSAIRAVSPNIMITVDQEGGRVQRFVEGFTRLPAMSHWGQWYRQSETQALSAMQDTLKKMITELRGVGAYASIAPVLDIDYGRCQVIGERSFGSDVELVTAMGQHFIDCMHRLGMPVMGKHFPGHGYVTGDSHHVLPVDERSFEQIASCDLQPFAQLASRLDAIMPAHVVYSQIDSKPAGFSRHWLQTVLREQLQFNGLIVTDDLTMQGAAGFGGYADRAHLAFEAGADIVIVCNSRGGVVEILDNVRLPKDGFFEQRLRRYSRFVS